MWVLGVPRLLVVVGDWLLTHMFAFGRTQSRSEWVCSCGCVRVFACVAIAADRVLCQIILYQGGLMVQYPLERIG
jgi:hypothetical protein